MGKKTPHRICVFDQPQKTQLRCRLSSYKLHNEASANLWKCHSNVLMIEVQELPSAGGTDTVKQIHAACVCVYARVKLKLAKAAQLN